MKPDVAALPQTAVDDPKPAKEADGTKRDEPSAPAAPESKLIATQLHSEGIIRTLVEHKSGQDDGTVIAPVIAKDPGARPKLPQGPYLQVGVFTHPRNAAELKAKLEAQGIPVFIATRVQVGPFKDKKEAEAMREKLKAMGMASVLINQ